MIHMNTDLNPSQITSPGCSACPIDDCPSADALGASLPSGRRLVLAVAALFLGPGVLAILGASCFPESQGAQFLAAIAGLAVGMAASVAALKRFHRTARTESTTSPNA